MRRKFKAHQMILVLSAIVTFQIGSATAATVQAQRDISAELARAQSFYQANQFEESLILLNELESRIGADPQRTNDLLKIKLYMGLAHLGLKQNDEAKSRFIEVCKIDSKFALDPRDYPPNVIAFYDESKAMCATPVRSAPVSPAVSIEQSTYLRGKELYDKGQYNDALKYFNVVLALDKEHELAREYSDLARLRLELAADRGYIDWRTNFDARQFEKAAAVYTRIRADQQPNPGRVVKQIESEYQKTLSGLVASWKAACAAGELNGSDSIRNEAVIVSSGLQLGREALTQMESCTTSAKLPNAINNSATGSSALATTSTTLPANPPKPVNVAPRSLADAPGTCFQGDPLMAITRLKTRVNPRIEPNLRRYVARGFVVTIQIDEQGNVKVKNISNTNPRVAEVIKSAVEQWKFNPTVIDGQVRCVDTELPISVIQQ
jgi:tetratricopeptide (TPR) repeat protein